MRTFFMQGDFTPVKALRQRWQQKSFSYLHYPRPDHGLMLLINGHIDFVWTDGILHAQAGDLIYLPQGCLYEAIFRSQPIVKTQREQTLEKALALLQESDSSIRDVARACSVSESGLRQLFQEKLHLSPTRYRLQMKIRRAQYLLESTDMTVNEISDALVFFDAAYFCRVFREHTGMTPKNYAKNKKL